MGELKGKQLIMDIFYQYREKKMTPAECSKTMKQINELEASGYSLDDIENALRYTINHPPKDGFHSFGFLLFTIGETLTKLKLDDLKFIQPEERPFEECIEEAMEDNRKKYEKSKAQVKGIKTDF